MRSMKDYKALVRSLTGVLDEALHAYDTRLRFKDFVLVWGFRPIQPGNNDRFKLWLTVTKEGEKSFYQIGIVRQLRGGDLIVALIEEQMKLWSEGKVEWPTAQRIVAMMEAAGCPHPDLKLYTSDDGEIHLVARHLEMDA